MDETTDSFEVVLAQLENEYHKKMYNKLHNIHDKQRDKIFKLQTQVNNCIKSLRLVRAMASSIERVDVDQQRKEIVNVINLELEKLKEY
mgnify:CR=1 FL=1|jgi:hypothetical protein